MHLHANRTAIPGHAHKSLLATWRRTCVIVGGTACLLAAQRTIASAQPPEPVRAPAAPAMGAQPALPPAPALPAQPALPPPEATAKTRSLIAQTFEPEATLEVDPRYSKILRTKRPVTRISITHPEVLEVVQFSPYEFELIGGGTGQTTLTMWFAGPDARGEGEMLRYVVTVRPNEMVDERRKIEYGEMERRINEFFPDSHVQLTPIADKLIVRGQARDSKEAAEIMAVLRGDSGDVKTSGDNPIRMGVAATPFASKVALPPSNIINMLDVVAEMQVMLRVRVAELSRTALRAIGTDLRLDFGDFSFISGLGLNGPVSAVLTTTDVKLTLQALSSNGYGKILAEPNVVTLSGHPAYFIAGGEFAVPTVVGVEGVGAVSTSFRGFGTQVAFTPTVIDKDRIRLQVAPSVSSLNQANSVDGIPGLDTRSVATTVDLREGQWLAIAGLIQDEQTGTKVRVPFLGDIPVVDMFFSKRDVRRNETELLIMVSPELVHPLEAEQMPLVLPGMELHEPTDLSFFIAGNYEGREECEHRSTVWPVLQRESWRARVEAKREVHYQRSENRYLKGAHGFSE